MMNIRPFFSHYIGFDEEAHAIFALNSTKFGTPTVPFLFVGTNFGRCLLFSSLSLKQVAALYEDAERRQIVAIGRWPFAEEIKKVSSDCIIIWLHFRCHSIALFELIVDNDFFRLRSLRELSTGHYGFCHALSDPVGGRMFIPDHEELSSSLRICYRTGGEKVLVLGEQFMKKSWARRTKGCSSTAPDLEEAMFKGLIMGVEVISQDQLLLVFEDSTVCAFNLHTNAVIDALKHPKRPEFLCWSVLPLPLSSSADGISPLGALVAVSVIGQLYLLNYCSTGFDDEANGEAEQQVPTPPPTHKQLLRAECKVKQCKRDFECTALAFCDNSKQHQQSVNRLASGFKNGTIEIRSVFMAPSVGDEKWRHRRWTTTLLAKCDFHTCAIRVLSSLVDVVGCVSESSPSSVVNFHQKDSSNIPHFNVGQCSPPSSPQHLLLISGASDGKISLFVLCQ